MTATMPLSALDFAVIALYFAVVLGAGLFMGRFVKSSGDFFSGGKRVPWWMGAISSYMAMISCFVFIAYAQIGYEDGLVGITVFWSTVFAILVGTFVFARRWQRADMATPVEYLERRYGAGVRQVISWSSVVFRVLTNAVRLYTLGIIASQFLGVSLVTGIWLGALIVLVYSMTGGLWSVLVTDIIQCVVLMGVAVTILPMSLHAVGGLGALHAALPDHFSLLRGHRGTFYFLAAYYLVVFITYNGNWAFIQRLTSVPNERDAVKMGLLSAAIFFVFPIIAVLPAVAARVYLPDLPPEMHERCYIEMCARLLPHGMLGMMVAAMLSASLSTLGAEFNVTSSVLTTDIYRRIFRKTAGEKELLLIARLGTLGVAALIAVVALYVAGIGGAFEANKLLMALFGVPIIIPSVFGILWKTPNTASVYLCLAVGVASGLCVRFVWPSLSWEAGTFLQIGVCFAGYFAGALFGTSNRERETKEILFTQLSKTRRQVSSAAVAVALAIPLCAHAISVDFADASDLAAARHPDNPFQCLKAQPESFFRLIPQVGVTHLLTDDVAHNAVWDMAVSPEGRVFFSSCGESYVPAYARLYEYDHAAKRLVEHFRLEDRIAQSEVAIRASKFHTAISFVGDHKMLMTSHTTSPSSRHATWMPYEHYNHAFERFQGSDILLYDYVTGETRGLGKICDADTTYGATYDPKNGDLFATTWMRGEGLVYNLKTGRVRSLGQVSDTHTSRAFRCSDGHIYSSTFSGAMYRYNTTARDIEYLGVSIPEGMMRHAVEVDGKLYFTTGSCGVWGRCMILYSYDLATRELKEVGRPVPKAEGCDPDRKTQPEFHAYGLAVDAKRRFWYTSLVMTPTIKYSGAKLYMWDLFNGKEPVDCGYLGTAKHTLSLAAEMRVVGDVLYISDGNHTSYEETPCGILAIDLEPFCRALADPSTPRVNSHDFVNYLVFPTSCWAYYPKKDMAAERAKYEAYDREVVQRFRALGRTSWYRLPYAHVSGLSVWEKLGRENAAVRHVAWQGDDALTFWCGKGFRVEATVSAEGDAAVRAVTEAPVPKKESVPAALAGVTLPGLPGRQHLAMPRSWARLADGTWLVGTADDTLAHVTAAGVRNEGSLGTSGPVHALATAPDGRTVYGVAGHDRGCGVIFRWTAEKGIEQLGLPPEARAANGRNVALYRPTCLAVSPDGRRLAVGGDDEVGGVAVLTLPGLRR